MVQSDAERKAMFANMDGGKGTSSSKISKDNPKPSGSNGDKNSMLRNGEAIDDLSPKQRELILSELGSPIEKKTYDNNYELEDGREYSIYNTREEAHAAAIEQMENLWDDIGITAWNQDFAEGFADPTLVDIAFKQVQEHNDYELSRSLKVFANEDGDDLEDVRMELFEASIQADGIGHTLSGYDGEEIELDDGTLAYRTN